ncbi:MAG: pentapeptide repeat-containing protein [Armatimonas sp.]
MKKSGVGIKASSSGDWKFKRANLKNIFVELSKGVGKAAGGAVSIAAGDPLKGWSAILTAIPDAVATLTNAGMLTEENRAHTLVQRALSTAIAEIVGDTRNHIITADLVGEGLLESAGADEEAWTLSPAFLERPREVELIQFAQLVLEKWLVQHGVSDGLARARSEVLPDSFCLKLHDELAQHAAFYEPLLSYLKLQTSALVREQWEWERYRSSLIAMPHQRLFDDEDDVKLSDVFVPLSAYWFERGKGEGRRHLVDVEIALTEWFDGEERDDYLRVLSGDPGSGKTSCSRIWAAKIAKERPGWRVLYIPLHELNYSGNLRESLRNYLRDEENLDVDLLVSQCRDKVLLCVDGLDELAMAGATAQEAATNFVRHLVGVLNTGGGRIRALLGGRELIVSQCKNEMTSKQVLYMTPYSDEKRSEWWSKYGAASKRGYLELPEDLEREDLEELTRQPLFNYLIALSYNRFVSAPEGADVLNFANAVTVNEIYGDLLRSVWQRRWGTTNPHIAGEYRSLEQVEFEDLLEEVAVVVWQSGSRAASLKDIEMRCKQENLTEAIGILNAEARKGVFRLLTAFHFRFSGEDNQSVEFTHKSFGEYLTARRIVRLMSDITERRIHAQGARRPNWDSQPELVAWGRLCGPVSLDDTDLNLSHFLIREVRGKSEEVRSDLEDTFVILAWEMINDGMPMDKLGLPSFQEMEHQARNAEESLLCALFGTINRAPAPTAESDHIFFLGKSLVSRWNTRDTLTGWQLAGPVVSSLSFIGVTFPEANLVGANLEGAYLDSADLRNAYLIGASLNGACLYAAKLDGAIMRDANLRRADMRAAQMDGVDLRDADLTDARLEKAAMFHVDLREANLARADLRDAHLWGANLDGSQIEDTNLKIAYLNGAILGQVAMDFDS